MLTWMAGDFAERGIASPRLDAELLLARALQVDRVRLYLDFERPLDSEELDATRALVRRRRTREPVAYILGEKEFYRRAFLVDRAVLIPRPDTEVLVDRALEALSPKGQRALDLCTGSGAIAVSLAAEREALRVDATDLSEAALSVAQENARRLGVAERLAFHRGDLFDALETQARYALITANPPYVTAREWDALEPDVREHEPRLALVPGPDGLEVIERILARAPDWLLPDGRLLLEVGYLQARPVAERLAADPRYKSAQVHRDLAGVDRVVEVARAEF